MAGDFFELHGSSEHRLLDNGHLSIGIYRSEEMPVLQSKDSRRVAGLQLLSEIPTLSLAKGRDHYGCEIELGFNKF
jgi:hypothetical protein